MIKGFNSDIFVGQSAIHIQTEDWGKKNPFIVTQVFKNGAVVETAKTPYQEILPFGPISDEESIKKAMKVQHQKILDFVLSGKIKI